MPIPSSIPSASGAPTSIGRSLTTWRVAESEDVEKGSGERPGALLTRRTEEGMEPDDLLCSRNSRLQNDSREQADRSCCSQNAHDQMCSSDARSKEQSAYSLWGSWGIRRPSLGLEARLGQSIIKQSEGRAGEEYLPVGGRVRKLSAIKGGRQRAGATWLPSC